MGNDEKSTKMSKLNCIEVTVSAPGKVILHGEHSVVYGKIAVATSLDLRTTLSIKEYQKFNQQLLNLSCVDIGLKVQYDIQEIKEKILYEGIPLSPDYPKYNFEHPECIQQLVLIQRIEQFLENKIFENAMQKTSVITFLFLYCSILWPSGITLSSMDIETKTELKVSAGMGSSASFAVSIVGALFEFIKMKYRTFPILAQESFRLLTINETKVFTDTELMLVCIWAYYAEKITHGNPSGIDNSICTYGSVVEFRRGSEPTPLRLHHKLTGLLIDTKVPKNTKELVGKVAALNERFPDIITNTLDSMEIVTKKAIESLKKLSVLSLTKVKQNQIDFQSEYDLLGELAIMNQNMLRILGVSHPSIDQICSILEKHGFPGKLTGAGGGGYVIAIIPFYADKAKLKAAEEELILENFTVKLLELGGRGIIVH